MDMLDHALEYARLGFRVMPLRPRAKVPATEHGCKDATTDEDTIRNWWTLWPRANIGIATGEGLVVVDIDNDKDKGKTGSDSLRTWERAHGELPETVTCLTGSGGVHLYYWSPEQYRNAASLLPDVDIRADGGYVVAPPSVHPNGRTYEWEADHDPASARITAVQAGSPVAVLLASRKKKTPQEAPVEPVARIIPEGRRTSALVSLVGTLVDAGLSREAIAEAVRIENAQKCTVPLTDEELEREVLPALDRGWQPKHPYERPENAPRALPEPVPLSAVYADPPPLAPVLIDGVLRKGHKMLISGPSKAGKSFALMELAIAIAEGRQWLGASCAAGRVLYLNMEIDDPSCVARFLKIYSEMKIREPHPERISVWTLRGCALPLARLVPLIIERAQGFAAVIVDPLYKVMDGADENSNSDVARMVGAFDTIATATGASVIYAHHFAKGTAGDRDAIDRAAGAGTFARDPDAILTLTQLDTDDPADANRTAWRLEYILREFAQHPPVNVWWDYPLHRVDVLGDLEDVAIRTSLTQAARRKEGADVSRKNKQIADTTIAAQKALNDTKTGTFTLADWYRYAKDPTISERTARRRLLDAGYTIKESPAGKPAVYGK